MLTYGKLKKLASVIVTPSYRRALLKYGVVACAEDDEFFESLELKEIHTIIDIGSNRGQFALAARNHFPQATIHCFEPLLEPATILHKVFTKDTNIKIYEVAIGPVNTQSTIHVSGKDYSSSLLPISKLCSEIYPGTEEKELRLIQVCKLEEMITKSQIESPALLKIDVQGYESQTIEGCLSLLPFISFIFIECSFIPLYSGQALAHEIISMLTKNSFILRGVYNVTEDKFGQPIQADFFFSGTNIL